MFQAANAENSGYRASRLGQFALVQPRGNRCTAVALHCPLNEVRILGSSSPTTRLGPGRGDVTVRTLETLLAYHKVDCVLHLDDFLCRVIKKFVANSSANSIATSTLSRLLGPRSPMNSRFHPVHGVAAPVDEGRSGAFQWQRRAASAGVEGMPAGEFKFTRDELW
jgi:hypothetical protein